MSTTPHATSFPSPLHPHHLARLCFGISHSHIPRLLFLFLLLLLRSEHTFTCSTVSVFQLLMVAISARRPSHCPSRFVRLSPLFLLLMVCLCLHLVPFRVDFFPYRTNCVCCLKSSMRCAHCNCTVRLPILSYLCVIDIHTHTHSQTRGQTSSCMCMHVHLCSMY